MTTPAKVAFLGLGVMGYPMAGHLKNKGGHDVTVYNRTTAKAEKWAGIRRQLCCHARRSRSRCGFCFRLCRQ